MAFLEPELIPAEAGLLEAVPQLLWLAALFFSLGCIAFVDGFTRALFGTVSGAVGWIPYVGSVLSAPIHSIEQKITSALGAAEAGIDSAMGHAFHQLASIVVGIGREFAGLGVALWQLGERLGSGLADVTTAGSIATSAESAAAAAAQAAVVVGSRAAAAEAGLWRGIDDLGGRLEGEVARVEDVLAGELAAARARIGELDRDLGHAWDVVKQHEKLLGLAGVTAAVGVALGELGLNWTRCDNNGALGRAYCGMPSSLVNDLLAALAVVAVGEFTLPELARWLQGVLGEVQPAVTSFWGAQLNGPGGDRALGATGL